MKLGISILAIAMGSFAFNAKATDLVGYYVGVNNKSCIPYRIIWGHKVDRTRDDETPFLMLLFAESFVNFDRIAGSFFRWKFLNHPRCKNLVQIERAPRPILKHDEISMWILAPDERACNCALQHIQPATLASRPWLEPLQ